MKPRSIAIVGASPKSRFGPNIINATRRFGFKGAIYPINPNYKKFEGLACYASLSALPKVPDCAIVILPAAAVCDVIEEAGRLGIKSAIVIAQGFSDISSPAGDARHAKLKEIAERYGMAITGPNCLGVVSYANSFCNCYADSIPPAHAAGGISIISQSGGMMLSAASYAAERGGGINYLISCGNQAVVELADYIDYLANDPATRVIAIIMEGARNGRQLRAAIERSAPKKPIVVLKLGRSSSGQRAALAHTGTLAGQDESYVAMFRQNGVAMAESLDGLMETAMLFELSKLPKGRRAAMFTISGGMMGLIADLGEAAGIEFPAFTAKTQRALGKALGVADRSFNNPMDTTGWPKLNVPGNLDKCLDALLKEPGIDLIGLGFRLQPADNQLRLLSELHARAKTSKKPIVFISTSSYTAIPFRAVKTDIPGLPILEDMELGQRAVARLMDYGIYRAGLKKAPKKAASARPLRLDLPTGRASLTEFESKKTLAGFGLPVTRERLATSAAEAARGARAIGFPVALKIQSPDVLHKTDAGGVALSVATAKDAEAAYRRILKNVKKAHPKAAIDGVLVQEMISGGTEMILGMNNDEQLGPVVMLGLGGVFVEIMKDVSLRYPPLNAGQVHEMLSELKGGRLLKGYRGAPAGDVAALVKAVVAFSKFVAATDGSLAAIDVNPLIVLPRGQGVRIADALIVPA